MNLFSEVVEGTSQRGLDERSGWEKINGQGRDAEITVKTAEFVVRNSKDGTLGGAINAIELDQQGKARWVRREKNCR